MAPIGDEEAMSRRLASRMRHSWTSRTGGAPVTLTHIARRWPADTFSALAYSVRRHRSRQCASANRTNCATSSRRTIFGARDAVACVGELLIEETQRFGEQDLDASFHAALPRGRCEAQLPDER